MSNGCTNDMAKRKESKIDVVIIDTRDVNAKYYPISLLYVQK